MEEKNMAEAKNSPSTLADEILTCARYNEDGDTARLESLLKEHPEMVNCEDDLKRTPLHMAAANGHDEIVNLLMKFDPEKDKANVEGNTALHYAATNNKVSIAKVLLENKFNINAKNVFGKTALQEIANKQFEDMEVVLLQFDKEVDNYAGGTLTIDEDLDDKTVEKKPPVQEDNGKIQKESKEIEKKGEGAEKEKTEELGQETKSAESTGASKKENPSSGDAQLDDVE